MYFMRALFDFLTEFSIFDAPDPVNRFEVRGNFSVIRRKKGALRFVDCYFSEVFIRYK